MLRAVLLLAVLLLASSCIRAIVTPTFPVVPLVEIALELLVIGYLATPRVRDAFRPGL